MKCINLPRCVVEEFQLTLNPNKAIWISIQEPDNGKIHYPHTKNEFLDKLPSLKLKFHDLTESVEYKNEIWHPASKSDVNKIIKFILDNPGKNVIVNCAAGVSRSGAICKFLEEKLGYSWEINKEYASPNPYLFNLLVSQYAKWY